MKTIDVKTTQNVTITYELAEVRDRIFAFLIDLVIMIAGYLILVWILFLILGFTDNDVSTIILYTVIAPPVIFYSLWSELLMHGQSIGKKALRIKVIKMDGRQPGFSDYLSRWIFRILDIYLSMGVIATILAASSDFAQRLGDIASNTTVVKTGNRNFISLSEILKIDSRQNYEPVYPAISNFREEDILLIKQTIERYQRYRNEAHKQAILMLVANLKKKLEIEEEITEHIKFLKTLIKDYIVLTR